MRAMLIVATLFVGTATVSADTSWQTQMARAAIAAHVGAQMADLSTSMFGIGAGTLVERNPILAPLSHDPLLFAVAKGGVALATAYVFLRLHRKHPVLTTFVAGLGAGLTGWAAAHNRRELAR